MWNIFIVCILTDLDKKSRKCESFTSVGLSTKHYFGYFEHVLHAVISITGGLSVVDLHMDDTYLPCVPIS